MISQIQGELPPSWIKNNTLNPATNTQARVTAIRTTKATKTEKEIKARYPRFAPRERLILDPLIPLRNAPMGLPRIDQIIRSTRRQKRKPKKIRNETRKKGNAAQRPPSGPDPSPPRFFFGLEPSLPCGRKQLFLPRNLHQKTIGLTRWRSWRRIHLCQPKYSAPSANRVALIASQNQQADSNNYGDCPSPPKE